MFDFLYAPSGCNTGRKTKMKQKKKKIMLLAEELLLRVTT